MLAQKIQNLKNIDTERFVDTFVLNDKKEPVEVILNRIGVSDTLYVSRSGHELLKNYDGFYEIVDGPESNSTDYKGNLKLIKERMNELDEYIKLRQSIRNQLN